MEREDVVNHDSLLLDLWLISGATVIASAENIDRFFWVSTSTAHRRRWYELRRGSSRGEATEDIWSQWGHACICIVSEATVLAVVIRRIKDLFVDLFWVSELNLDGGSSWIRIPNKATMRVHLLECMRASVYVVVKQRQFTKRTRAVACCLQLEESLASMPWLTDCAGCGYSSWPGLDWWIFVPCTLLSRGRRTLTTGPG